MYLQKHTKMPSYTKSTLTFCIGLVDFLTKSLRCYTKQMKTNAVPACMWNSAFSVQTYLPHTSRTAATFDEHQSFRVGLFILSRSAVDISLTVTVGELRHFKNSVIRVFPGCHSSNNTENWHCRVCFLLLCLWILMADNKFYLILQTAPKASFQRSILDQKKTKTNIS